MHLSRIEMTGFKSFADSLELDLRPGISCIVGPNGCGKSNVADAISWALGSQSPSQLRAERMEDVIFSGSEARGPLGMAEVTLTFDNAKRELPLDFDEVTVTRRLFRNGDSEYLIGGSRCRLMDVTDLIVDKGLGSSGYWLLEARMIESIVESRPADRRFLFDEAAGIVKYKIQRHRAELRLNAVSADLERLDDIIDEVSRTVSGLRRQVRDFRRWESAARRMEEMTAVLAGRELTAATAGLAEAEARLSTLTGREQELSASVSSLTARLSETRVRLEGARGDLDRAHSECAGLDSGIGSTREEQAMVSERLRNMDERMDSLREDIEASALQAGNLGARASELAPAVERLEARRAEAALKAESAAEKAAGVREGYLATSGELERLRELLRAARARVEGARREREERLRSRERASARRASLTGRSLELEESVIGTREAAAARRSSILELEGSLAGLSGSVTALEDEAAAIDGRVSSLREELSELRSREGMLRSRASELERPEVTGGGRSIPEMLRTREGAGLAVGAWLDSFQEASVRGADELPGTSGGERFLLEEGGAGDDLPELPPEATRLSDLLLPGADPLLRRLLSRAAMVPERETALRLHAEDCGVDLVTPRGDLFRRDGLVRLGVPPEGGGAVEREALAAAALAEADRLSGTIERLGGELEGLAAEAAGKREELRKAREGLERARREEAGTRARLEENEAALERLERESREVAAELDLLETESDGADPVDDTVGEAAAELERLSSELTEAERGGREAGEALAAALDEERSRAMALASVESELSRLTSEMRRASEGAASAESRTGELRERLRSIEESREGLVERSGELDRTLAELTGERTGAEERRRRASAARAELLEQTSELEGEVAGRREELSSARETRASLSGEVGALRRRMEELAGQVPEDLEEPDELRGLSEEEIGERLEAQRRLRENMGPVNMLAVAEHEEASGRLSYLREQRGDLRKARDSLLRAIEEINVTAAKRFEETFVVVRENFRKMFELLFGGGQADIRSVDADDPLEGGVQIMARPPGKKLENVAALSGGERAMTAVALLFALYLVKPSPFCVLDELDAPLDDSNIDRFVDLLQSFSDRTQFVVITHNKRTMEAADRLFGITMAEKGVSTLTTVSLEGVSRGTEDADGAG